MESFKDDKKNITNQLHRNAMGDPFEHSFFFGHHNEIYKNNEWATK